jgi:hypothetical protein
VGDVGDVGTAPAALDDVVGDSLGDPLGDALGGSRGSGVIERRGGGCAISTLGAACDELPGRKITMYAMAPTPISATTAPAMSQRATRRGLPNGMVAVRSEAVAFAPWAGLGIMPGGMARCGGVG